MDAIYKLQKFDPEKFTELCRMHLTFTLDLHDNEFAALIDSKTNKKKVRSYFSRFVKEKSVTEVMPLTQETISHIYQIIEYLGRDANICKEGLFRKTGSILRQNELKTLLLMGENIDFSSGHYNVHDCACVLKTFLAELPEPLLSEAHYSAHCQITDMHKDGLLSNQVTTVFERRLKSTKLLLLLLPPNNYCLLKYLLLLLNQIQNAEEKNKMSSDNLATLFAPHIICPRKMSPQSFKQNFPCMVKCVKFLVENALLLFDPPKELVEDVKLYLKEMSYEGQLQAAEKENEPIKTTITFCDRAKQETSDYTNKALAELQMYIETLPNSSRKRKLIKKLHKENNETIAEPGRKHFRSRSVGEAIKRHLKSTNRKREDFNFHRSTFDMVLPISKSTDSIASVAGRAASVEALNLEEKESSKFSDIRKNFLRASRKKKAPSHDK